MIVNASQAAQIEAQSNGAGISSIGQTLSNAANLLPWWVWVAIPIICLLYAIYRVMKPFDEKAER